MSAIDQESAEETKGEVMVARPGVNHPTDKEFRAEVVAQLDVGKSLMKNPNATLEELNHAHEALQKCIDSLMARKDLLKKKDSGPCMTPSTFLESLAWQLRVHGQGVNRDELEAFVQFIWPLVEDDPDIGRWANEYVTGLATRNGTLKVVPPPQVSGEPTQGKPKP